jgi:hypothetical protein
VTAALPDPIRVAVLVAETLEACSVRYTVGGSVASSISGEPRSTLDIDVVVAMSERDVDRFLAALGDGFYVEPEALRRAIRGTSRANLVHRETSIKVDLFIQGESPLDAEALSRRQRVRVAVDPERHLYVHAPEDILLQKLRWYRLGREMSDRQWRDVLGILLVQAGRLDEEYLRRGAEVLGVADLLERVRREVSGR